VIKEEVLQIILYISKWGYGGLKRNPAEVTELIGGEIEYGLFKELSGLFDCVALKRSIGNGRTAKSVIKAHKSMMDKTVTQFRVVVEDNLNKIENGKL